MTQESFNRPQINLTKNLKIPNAYTIALDGEYRDVAFNEERAPGFLGRWRAEIFKKEESYPIDLEIGTGNGVHFRTHCLRHPERGLVGIELKYKPLIQTIRGALRGGSTNARIARYHAFNVDLMFAPSELNNIFIHFPDPWTSPRKPKNRILNPRMLDILWSLQRPGSTLDFKTDSQEAFLWSLENIPQSKYKLLWETRDLHKSGLFPENVITQFEKIFLAQGLPIYMLRLARS